MMMLHVTFISHSFFQKLVQSVSATIPRCGTVPPKHDFSGSTRNNRVRAEKSTRPWSERRLGLAAGDTYLSTSPLFGVQFRTLFHAFSV